jgi:HK97 family phage portal protein
MATRVRGVSMQQWMAERRDPTAATTQLRWHGRDQAQVTDWNADLAVRFGYHVNVIAFRAVTVIADTLSQLKFRAGVAPPENAGAPAEHNPDARLAQLLGPPPAGPNGRDTAKKLWGWTVTQRLVTGRNGWEIELDGSRVVALWPLVSANLKAIPSGGGSSWWSRFEYGRPDDLKKLSAEQVHYGWSPAASDYRQPFSPLQVARYALSIGLAVDQHTYGFLKNGGVPAYVVGVEAFENPEAFEGFKRQWRSSYGEPENAGGVHFVLLDPGTDGDLSKALFIETVGMSAKDARLPESYRAALEQVAIALGVPWSKLDASGRTFDNASEEDRTFWSSTIAPLATDLADEVNIGLAPRLGPEVGWFDMSGVRALQPVPVAAPSEIPGLIAAGVISPAEARPWLFLSGPAPEVPVVETVEVDDDVESGSGDRAGGGAGGRGHRPEGEGGQAGEAGPQAGRQEARREEVEHRATEGQEARRGAIWRATDAVIVGQERAWERAWRRMFNRQLRATITNLESSRRSAALARAAEARGWGDEKRGPADGVFDRAHWTAESEQLATDLFEQLASSSFARLSAAFGLSFDLEAEFAQLFITSRANQLAGQVTDTTYRAITSALAEGVAAGESIPSLAARIRAVFDEASSVRATMIARTEVISGFNASGLAAASSLPADVVAAQQWIATRDSRTRPTHASADGQIVAVGQPFSVGGVGCAYPGDPALPAGESVNCRCTVAFLTPDEFEAEATLYAQSPPVVSLERARVALAMVVPGHHDEARFRRVLGAAA